MEVYIKKNSTLPEIRYKLTQEIREWYNITDEMLENVAVTFSMINQENGLYLIANVGADLEINRNRLKYPDEVEYTLKYRLKSRNTKKTGRFVAEFKLDFIGENTCGSITLPVDEEIHVNIFDSITKTIVM